MSIKLAEKTEDERQQEFRSDQVNLFKDKLRSIVKYLNGLDVDTMTNAWLPFTENRDKVIHFRDLVNDASQLLAQAADELDGIEKPHHLRKFKETMANSNKQYELLLKLAETLENPENETLIAVENDEEALNRVATVFSKAAEALRDVADEIMAAETQSVNLQAITEQDLEQMAAIAESFAESDDELLQKQASVLDNILFALASPVNRGLLTIAKEDDRIEELKKKYKEVGEQQKESDKISEAVEAIEKSDVYKPYRSLEQGLSTRYCPIHSGVSLKRIGENKYACSLDNKEFDFSEGFEGVNGKVPGSSVNHQGDFDQNSSNFTSLDSRANRMGKIDN